MKSPSSGINIGGWWYGLDQRAKIALAVGLGVFVIILCIAAVLVARTAFAPAQSEPTEESTASATRVPTEPPPTWTPKPTETPPPPTDVPVPTDTPVPADAQGDVVTYDDALDPVEEFPPGIDILVANIGSDLSVPFDAAGEVPDALAEFATDEDVLLWIELQEALPDPPEDKLEWIFVLDVDSDSETGRPAGARPVNPDLGYEAAVSLSYNPDNEVYSTYYAVWDDETGGWITSSEVRYTIDDSGTLIGLAVSREALTEAIAETSGTTVVPDAVLGRAAALAGQGAERIADFYPDLP
jgi:hypothetical protein